MSKIWAIARVALLEMLRRKHAYVVLLIAGVLTALAASINLFNDERIVRYLREVSLALIWIGSLVLAVASIARQLPNEGANRTIQPLLAKPLGRGQLLVGKFLGSWLANGAVLLLLYSLFLGANLWKGEHLSALGCTQAILLHWLLLALVISATLLGSLVFTAPSSNAVIVLTCTAGLLFLAQHLNKVALRMEEPARSLLYAVYHIVPHLEWYDARLLLIHNWPPIPATAILIAVGYATLYSGAFLLAAKLIFQRRPLL
ncbi:MAG: ABC transporter permease [Verrucomicrobiae bacterium]|jgi:Cu-processing system permease protein|nr:ABC transporter permease [Verrucomicrobiae bacterium]